MIILALFFIVWGAIAWLFFVNRSADKIWETMIVVTIIMIGSLSFVLKPQKLEERIFASYFYNIKSNNLVHFKGFASSYMMEQLLLNEYFNEQKKKGEEPGDIYKDLLLPLVEKHVVEWFGFYGAWPTIFWRASMGGISSYKGLRGSTSLPTNVKGTKISKGEIESLLQHNVFAGYSVYPGNMVLPRGMTLEVKPTNNSSQIIFQNKFCKITIDIRVGGSHIIQSHMPIAKFLDAKDAALEGTYVATVHLVAKAKFSRWFAGNPEMETYRNWASDKLALLKQDFDWENTRKLLLENVMIFGGTDPD